MKILHLILLFASISLSVFGQETIEPSEIVQDQYEVTQEYLDENALDNFRNDDDFIYEKAPPPKEKNWLSELIYELAKALGKIFRVESQFSLWAVLKYGFFGFIILFIIRKLFGTDLKTLFYKNSEVATLEYETITENIHELNYNTEIQEAIQKGNYRKAVRLYYLKSLKALADKEIIKWQIDKTNGDYRREVSQSNYARSFGEITKLFDYIWYGEFPIDKSLFDNTEEKFQKFIKTIGN